MNAKAVSAPLQCKQRPGHPNEKSDGFATALIVTRQHNYRNVFVNMIVRCFQRKQSKKFNLKFLFGDLSCQDYAALM